MKKEELIKLVDSLGFPKTEYYILAGGSMLLYGLRETTQDLDLCVSNELFKKLKETDTLTKNCKIACTTYSISEKIEVIPEEKKNFKRTYVNVAQVEYPVERLESILAFKEKRKLPKDEKDIELIQNYLKKNRNSQ